MSQNFSAFMVQNVCWISYIRYVQVLVGTVIGSALAHLSFRFMFCVTFFDDKTVAMAGRSAS